MGSVLRSVIETGTPTGTEIAAGSKREWRIRIWIDVAGAGPLPAAIATAPAAITMIDASIPAATASLRRRAVAGAGTPVSTSALRPQRGRRSGRSTEEDHQEQHPDGDRRCEQDSYELEVVEDDGGGGVEACLDPRGHALAARIDREVVRQEWRVGVDLD